MGLAERADTHQQFPDALTLGETGTAPMGSATLKLELARGDPKEARRRDYHEGKATARARSIRPCLSIRKGFPSTERLFTVVVSGICGISGRRVVLCAEKLFADDQLGAQKSRSRLARWRLLPFLPRSSRQQRRVQIVLDRDP